MDLKRRVILVTDGDSVARKTVELAAKNIGARCISCSAGNPTPLTGEKLVDMIKSAQHDPVVVMLDDKGHLGSGKGERAMEYICQHPEIEVLGVLAVASNTMFTVGAHVDASVTRDSRLVSCAVDKMGWQHTGNDNQVIYGDTVEVINQLNMPVVIGIGDIGKMDRMDDPQFGAPVTTMALKEILNRSGFHDKTRNS